MPRFSDHRRHADAIVAGALRAADPAAALLRAWPDEIGDSARSRGLQPSPVRLLAFGKASLEMARAATDRLGPALASGLVVAVPERASASDWRDPRVAVLSADHPLPTARNLVAAEAVLGFVSGTPPDQDLLVLISGGGSAHLTLPAGGLTLDDLRGITSALQRAGAPIRDLNAVRKHLERLKGGRLGESFAGRRLVALIVSDVMGDPVDVISSGATAPDPTTYGDALGVLDRYGVGDAAPRVRDHLRTGVAGRHAETPKPGAPWEARVENRVIANNTGVLLALQSTLNHLGFRVVACRPGVEGEARHAGSALARELGRHRREGAQGLALLQGGEPTVTVGDSPGIGGPSQELALAAAVLLDGVPDAALVAFSTDGIDGPTDAAGAVVTGGCVAQARQVALDLAAALTAHDSHRALDGIGALIRTGPTGTNVNHVAVGLVY